MTWIWGALGFEGVTPAVTGRPACHPATLLKLYIYGYLNKVQSSRRLEREAQRNVELMWLTGRLAPDHKTIADVRKDNGPAIQVSSSKWHALVSRRYGRRRAAMAASSRLVATRLWAVADPAQLLVERVGQFIERKAGVG